MSTIQEFKDAPVGATAKNGGGRIVIRERDETGDLPWVCTASGELFCNDELAEGGYMLVPSVPTTAREALDLAWELAHPVKEGQEIPEGTHVLFHPVSDDFSAHAMQFGFTVTAWDSKNLRTHEPLPDPKPDWLDAPAVLATGDFDRRGIFFPVADRSEYWQFTQTGLQYHWQELTDVTPLYPKEEA